jgi:hypothetical protein
MPINREDTHLSLFSTDASGFARRRLPSFSLRLFRDCLFPFITITEIITASSTSALTRIEFLV